MAAPSSGAGPLAHPALGTMACQLAFGPSDPGQLGGSAGFRSPKIADPCLLIGTGAPG